MNAADPLAQLNDIHTPESVAWWPPAPLWWLLAALVLIALAAAGYYWRRRKRAEHYRRLALARLEKAPADAGPAQLQAINALLKRTAIQAYGRSRCAPLHGDDWLAFLDAALSDHDHPFQNGPGRILGDGLYRPQPDYDSDALMALARNWVKKHRRPLPDTEEAADV